jgi:hydrogenase-4 component E
MTQFNALMGGLFILTAFGIVGLRQILGSLRLFVVQSILLAGSAFIVGLAHASTHLFLVAGIILIVKAFFIPWLLYRVLSHEIHARREIEQVLDIPTSLLLAAGLTVIAYFIVNPLLKVVSDPFIRINLPVGMAGVLVGAYVVTVRREAMPQLLGILTMENGAFFAGIAIASDLSLLAELAAAFDVLIIALVVGLLTRRIHKQVGSTLVGEMARLKEE